MKKQMKQVLIALCGLGLAAETLFASSATSAEFALSIKHDGVRPSTGSEALRYSNLWDGNSGGTVTIAQNGTNLVAGLSGEGAQAWSVDRNGTYALTHTTYTNGLIAGVLHATFVVTDKPGLVTKLDVVASTNSVEGGATVTYQAIATLENGTTSNMTSVVDWSIDPAEYGTVSNGVLVTAETTDPNHKATVTASYTDPCLSDAITDSEEITITFTSRLKRPVSLTINGPDTIDAGATNAYTATVTYNDGTSVEKPLEAVWSVTPAGGVATVVKGDTNVKLTAAWTATGTLELRAEYTEGTETIDDGLVAWYKFDGDANDSSGNGNDGVVHGATLTTDRFGNANGAYLFDGNDWITAADSESLHDVTTAFTISVWMKQTAWYENVLGLWGAIVEKGDARQYGLQLAYHPHGSSYWCYAGIDGYHIGGTGAGDVTNVCKEIALDCWQHVTVTCDGIKTVAYLDGEKVGEIVAIDMPRTPNTEPLYIGFDLSGGDEYFIGAMDDLRIYNRALTAAEVKALYGKEDDGLVAWYKLDGDASDSCGNGYDLVNAGGAVGVEDRNGNENGAMHFTGANDSRLTAAVDVLTNTFSCSVWFKTDVTMATHGSSPTYWNPGNDILHAGNGGDRGVTGVGVGLRVGTDGIAIVEHANFYRPTVLTYNATLGSDWHHVVYIVESNGAPVVYLDGEYVATGSNDGYQKKCNCEIGGGAWGNYTGDVDDVRVYDYALTAEKVKSLYEDGLAGDVGTESVTVAGTKTVTVVALNPPTAPVVTAGDGFETNQLSISWNEPTSARPIIAYEVSRQKKDESGWSVLTSTLTSTNYVDTTAEPGEDYTYRVRGSNEAGWGSYGSDDGWRAISLALDPTSWTAGYGATNCAVEVTANTGWAIAAATGDATTSTTADGFTASLAANATLSDRSGSVTVTAGGSTDHPATATFAYTQAKRPARLTGLEIVDGTSSIEGGSSTNFHAIAIFDDGSTNDVTSAATWSIDPSAYGTISAGDLTTYETTDVGRRATIKATYEYTVYDPKTLTAEKEIGIDFTMALLKPVSIVIEGDDEMRVTESKFYRAIVGWNNVTTTDVSVAEGMAWTTPAPYGAVKKDTDAAKLTAYGVGKTLTLTGTYTFGTNSVAGTKDVVVKEFISLPIAVDLEDADVSTSGAFRVIHYNLNFSPKTIAAAEGAIVDSSTWIGSPVTGEYATISFRNADDRDGLPHLGTVSFPGISGGYHEHSYFACLITGKMLIPEAGDWTFACDIDDGFQFDLTGHGATYVFDRDGITSLKTDLKTFHIAEAGIYDIRAIFYDQGGQAVLSMAAAKGVHTTFDTSVFKVIGTADSEITVVPLGKKSDLVLSTGGTSGIGNDWYGQLNSSHDLVDAGQSGKIFGAGESWMSTVVTNAGDISFWWKTSCEATYDYLKFEVDGEVLAQTSGTTNDWRQLKFEIPGGTHTLRWTYAKDDKNDVGSDCGWVDQLVWNPLSAPSPTGGVACASIRASDGTSADYVEVEWVPFGSKRNIYEYELSRAVAGSEAWEILAVSNVLRFVDFSAVPGVDYTYRVRARNDAGWGEYVSDDGWRAYAFAVDPQLIIAPHTGCETSVVVTANMDWSFTVGTGEWLAAEEGKGNAIRVVVAENIDDTLKSLNARTNHVTVSIGGTSAHATNVVVEVVQMGRPAKYDVGFVKPYEDWRTRLQVLTNTTEAGAYAPVSVFAANEPLDISFGWTNRSEITVPMPSIRFRLYSPDTVEPVSEWNVEGRAGEMLAPGAGAWSGAWPFEPLKVLKPGDYRLEAELAPDMNDINREGDKDSDKADNIAIFRFAVRNSSLALATDVFGDDHWKKLELTPGNDFAQPPHAARWTLGVDGASHEGVAVQFGPYVPMNGVKISGSTGRKALDLVLLVDDSISMGEGIEGLVKNISDMVDELLKGNVKKKIDPISDLRIKVVGYYDYKDYDFYGTGNITRPWFKEYPFSTDPDTLKQELAVLRDGVSGGSANDGESSFDALYYLCKGWTQDTFYGKPLGHQDTQYGFRDLADASRVVLIFTDEPPHCLPYEDKNNRECNVPGCEGLTLKMMDDVLREAGVNLMIVGDGLYQGDMGTYTNGHKYKDLVDMDPDTRSLVEPEPADRYRGALAKMTADATFIRNLASEVSKKVVTKITKVEPSLSAYAKGSGVLTFSWCNNSTSTAGEKNTFSFECDGGITNLVNAVGEGWKTESLRLEEGSHTFKWSYGKIDYEGAISDCGLIGDIVWEPDHTQLSITPKFFSIDHPGSWESRDEDTNKVIRVGEGNQKVRVTCNSSWTVVTNDVPDWITFVTLEGVGNGEIVFQVATNETHELRKATVIVRADEYALEATNAYVEQEFRVEQKDSPYVEDGEIHILSVGVKPRWPWNDKVDIDFRVMTPKKTGTPVKVSFVAVNEEGGDLAKSYSTLFAARECKVRRDLTYQGKTVAYDADLKKSYVACPTSGIYRVTWSMGKDWYNASSTIWPKENSFHSPALSVRAIAECSGCTKVELPSDPVRVDVRQTSGSALTYSGGAILTGVEKIGHPTGFIDPVPCDSTKLPNGWVNLDEFYTCGENGCMTNYLEDRYVIENGSYINGRCTNRFDRACVINDAIIEGGIILTQTWWHADSVHVVRDNVFVHPQAKLIIEEGAVVKFCHATRIYIHRDTSKSDQPEEYNIVVKGAEWCGAFDDSYGGNVLRYNLQSGDSGEWNGKDRIYADTSAWIDQNNENGTRAVIGIALERFYGYNDGTYHDGATYRFRYYSRGQVWGIIPRPEEDGMRFYGWYRETPSQCLLDNKKLSASKYSSSIAYMVDSEHCPITDRQKSKDGGIPKNQIFALICPEDWTDTVIGSVNAEGGRIRFNFDHVVYDGTRQDPKVDSLTVGGALIATSKYETVYGSGDYIAAGKYAVCVNFLTTDYTNSPSATFTIEQRPIDGGEIRFSDPTNGVMYLPTLTKPTVTVHLPAIGDSVIEDAVATRDAKISWLDPVDHVWPEVGDYMVVASYEDNPNYTGGAITNVFTISVNPDYVFTEYYTLDEVEDQIEVFKSKYGRNPRIIRFSGRTNDVLSLDWKDKIRGNTALNDFVSTNFICWADNTAGDPGMGVRAIADLERDIVSTGGVLSVSRLFDFLSEALVAKELPVDASLAELSLVGGNSFEYNGSPHQPTVTVALGGVPISSDEYELVYSGDGVAVGTYSVYAVFDGVAYSGETDPVSYTVSPKALSLSDVSLDPASAVYDGTMHKPLVDASGIAYAVDCGTGDFTAVGTYSITVTASGNYTGTVTTNFVVYAKTVDAAVIELDQYQAEITDAKSATNLVPHVVRVYDGSRTYVPEVDYTIDVGGGDYTSVGTNIITATFRGNYTGTATATFVIVEVSSEKVPPLPDDSTEEDVANQIKKIGFEDPKVAERVTDVKTYNDFRVWAKEVGEEKATSAEHAYESYRLSELTGVTNIVESVDGIELEIVDVSTDDLSDGIGLTVELTDGGVSQPLVAAKEAFAKLVRRATTLDGLDKPSAMVTADDVACEQVNETRVRLTVKPPDGDSGFVWLVLE